MTRNLSTGQSQALPQVGGDFFDGKTPEFLEALAALLEDESEEGREAREIAAALMVFLTVKERILDPQSGILTYFRDTLDDTAELVDAYLSEQRS